MNDYAMTRRGFLAGVTVGATAAAAQGLQTDASKSGWIDAHSHIWTPDVARFPLRTGVTVKDLAPASFTAQQLLDVARPAGVGRVVLIAHHTYYGFDNRYLIDAARRFPQVFRVVGMIDDQAEHPERLMGPLLKQGVTGFRITSWDRKENWLEGAGMQAMWKQAAETRQAMGCLINPPVLASVDRMCEKFPDTPVVIDHFGRIGVDGKIRPAEVKQLCRLARHKNTYVKVSAYYALGKKKPPYLDLGPMIRQVRDAFGAERLMWASDSPYQLEQEHTYQASIDLIQKRLEFLSADEKSWLLEKTAAKVYYFA